MSFCLCLEKPKSPSSVKIGVPFRGYVNCLARVYIVGGTGRYWKEMYRGDPWPFTSKELARGYIVLCICGEGGFLYSSLMGGKASASNIYFTGGGLNPYSTCRLHFHPALLSYER